jgi:hypothetical protein
MGSNNLSVLPADVIRTTRRAHVQQPEGFSIRVMDRVRQVFCGMHGHDNMLQFEHEHLFLQCTSCGHQTPGWRLNDLPPARPLRSDSSTRTLVRRELDNVRQVA